MKEVSFKTLPEYRGPRSKRALKIGAPAKPMTSLAAVLLPRTQKMPTPKSIKIKF